MASSSQESQAIWRQAVDKKLLLLRRQDERDLLCRMDRDSLQVFLQSLSRLDSSSKSGKVLEILQPVLARFQAFTDAISTMVQADPTGTANLVWGSLQILLECIGESTNAVRKIVALLNELAMASPRFDEYMELYPRSHRLQVALRNIYDDYVDFFLIARNFYRQKPWWTFPRLIWRNVKETFDDCMLKLQAHRAEFDAETHLLNAKVTVHIDKQLPHLAAVQKFNPRIFEVPSSKNVSFFGRSQTLDQLHDYVRTKQAVEFSSCVIHGIGGVGKTQFALEFAYRYAVDYDCVFWLRAETAFDLAKTFADIAKRLSLSHELDDQAKNIQLAYDWLKSTDRRWLLVFDNYEADVPLRQYWAASPNGCVLLTTQDRVLAQDRTRGFGWQLPLQAFDVEEGSQFLISSLNLDPTEHDTARKVADLVSGLPLALAHIVGYVDGNCSLDEFREGYLQRYETIEIWGSGSKNDLPVSGRSLLTVFDMALSALSLDARKVIDVLAMLNPDAIQEDVLRSDMERNMGKSMYIETKRDLRKRHLVESRTDDVGSKLGTSLSTAASSHPNAVAGAYGKIPDKAQRSTKGHVVLSIHRSLQQNLLLRLSKSSAATQAVFDRALAMVSSVFPRQSAIMSPVNEKWGTYEQYVSHIWALHAVFEQTGMNIKGTVELATLFCDAGNYLWERGLIEDGLKILQSANQICEALDSAALGRVHADVLALTACLQVRIGISQRNFGCQNFERVMHLRVRHFEQISTSQRTFIDFMLHANGFNDQGCAFLHSEDYNKAEHLLEQALSIKSQIGNETTMPIEFGETRKNLAFVYMAQGDFARAIQVLEHATKLVEKESGTHCAATQYYRFQLACMLYNAGYYHQALETNLDVLNERADLFGEFGTDTLHSCFATGITYFAMGNLRDAERMLRRCLDSKATWSAECMARARYTLSQVLLQRENFEEGLRLELASVTVLEQLLEAHAPSLFVILEKGSLKHRPMLFDHIVTLHAGRFTIGQLDRAHVASDASLGALEVLEPHETQPLTHLNESAEGVVLQPPPQGCSYP